MHPRHPTSSRLWHSSTPLCPRSAAYNARYPMPQDRATLNTAPNWASLYVGHGRAFKNEASVQPNNSYYSLDVSHAHIVSLSSYVSGR